MWRNWKPGALPVGVENGAAIWGTVWKFLKKLRIELLYDPAIPRLGIYPRELKARSHSSQHYLQ